MNSDTSQRLITSIANQTTTRVGKLSSLSPTDALKSLEAFVEINILGQLPKTNNLIWFNGVSVDLNRLSTQDHFPLIGAYLDVISRLPTQYQYTNSINLFIECCEQIGWVSKSSHVTGDEYGRASLQSVVIADISLESYRHFVEILRARGNTETYRYLRAQTKRAVSERYKTCCDYVDALFENNDRLNVLRIDLAYSKEHCCFFSLADILNDLDHLTANMANNAIFSGLAGYIFKVEYGVEKGVHVHAIFFFNGSERRGASHIFHAQQIGEYWVRVITKGTGIYWNCNDQVKNFESLQTRGLGPMHWSDTSLRENLLNIVVHYVCKERQAVKSKLQPDRKMIRKKVLPRVREVKLGRPRHLWL